jgi:hypothetical protein
VGALYLHPAILSVITKIWTSKPPEMIWAIIGLTISHGISYMQNYIWVRSIKNQQFKKTAAPALPENN